VYFSINTRGLNSHNEKGDILYINGKIGRYIEINSGEPNMNIHRVVREEA